jgi:hypothetical protein
MAVNIVNTPTRFIDPGIQSRHTSGHNAVLFRFFRFDYGYGAAASSGGGASTTFTTTAAHAIPAGSLVYVKSLAGAAYDKAVLVLSVPDNTHVELDIPYLGASSNGFINSDTVFQNWYLQLKIEHLDPTDLSVISTLASPLFRPEANGDLRCDVHKYVKEFGGNENTFLYSNCINKMDLESGWPVKVSYRFCFVGYSSSYSSLGHYYIMNSVKQILDPYSGNMADYVPQIYLSVFPPDKIKLISSFEVPTYFVGFPFSLSFPYYDETLLDADAADVARVREFLDINKASTGSDFTFLDKTQRNRVNRLLLEDPLPAGTDHIPAGTKYMDIWLDNGDGLTTPPGMFRYKVKDEPGSPDGYAYHSIERDISINVPCKFTITNFLIDGVDQLAALPAQVVNIVSPADIHFIIGLNGSVQFRDLMDKVNSICDPLILRFYDDFAIHWRDCTTFLIKIDYETPTGTTPRTFQYTQAGFYDLPSMIFTPSLYDPY